MVTLRTLLGSLLACAILFSCTKETEQPMQPVQETGMYTLTVSADKGDRADTKALGFDSGAQWGSDFCAGTIIINGGIVKAYGDDYGAGIGGGQDGKGADVTISGGVVIAEAGKNATGLRAIGPGYGSDDYGQLSLGDYMMVKSERMAKEAERKNMCWYRTQVRVEPCTHPGYTAETCPYHVHD